MDTNLFLTLIALAVLIVVVAATYSINQRRKTEQLRKQFGPEYDRAVEEYGSQKRAEQELEAREKRVEAFDIHPVSPQEHQRFEEEWRNTQAAFVDAPDRAVADADRLVKQLMQAEGYPVGNFEQRAADVSVDHPNVVMHYRAAHEIAQRSESGKATTEDLRQAMVHYRALFEELLNAKGTENVLKEAA